MSTVYRAVGGDCYSCRVICVNSNSKHAAWYMKSLFSSLSHYLFSIDSRDTHLFTLTIEATSFELSANQAW